MRLELNQEPEHRVVWQSLRGDWDQIQFRGMVWHSEEIGIKFDSEVWFDTIRGNWDQIQFRGMVWKSQDYHPIVNAEWNNSGFDIINVIISSF